MGHWSADCFFSLKTEIIAILKHISSNTTKIQLGTFNLELGDIKAKGSLLKDMGSDALKISTNYLKTHEEELIKKQLDDAGVTTEKRVEILINNLAAFTTFMKLSNIDKNLFDEQKKLLANINKMKNGASSEILQPYLRDWKMELTKGKYLEFKKQVPDCEGWEIPKFVYFLINNGLLINQNSNYYITKIGQEYLAFCAKVGRVFPKLCQFIK